ncbi:MAG: cell division protein FtsQ/DivIB [Panacagrimonas sp.]
MSIADSLLEVPKLPSAKLSSAMLSFITVLIVGLMAWLLVPDDAPLTQLEVRGDFQHLRPEDVRTAAQAFSASSFFSADLDGLRDSVAALPWVARVRAERRWPGAVSVRVWEREAFARWNDNALLDAEARAFSPRASDVPIGLPHLGGVAGHEAEVADTWQRIAPQLQNTALALEGLAMDARGEWTARATNDIELRFGRALPDERMPTLIDVTLRTLDGRWGQVQYIDLRYTNGFAVGWREAEVAKETKP